MVIRLPEDEGVIYKRFYYPAGEQQVRLIPPLDRFETEEITIVARILYDSSIITLALLSDALWEIGAIKKLILPYLPYSRADRRFCDGDCSGLLVFSSLINIMGYDSITTLDAHSWPIGPHPMHGLKSINPKPLIEQFQGWNTIILPDEGAKRYGLSGVQCSKIRNPETGGLYGFKVPDEIPGTGPLLIVDDICDGGGTFTGLAKELQKFNRPLYLWITHGIFSKGFKELKQYFTHIFTTDSFSNFEDPPGFVTRYPVDEFLLQQFRK